MPYERMLFAGAVCFLGAEIAVNGFKPLTDHRNYDIDELARLHQIEAYLKRCVNSGAIPTRRWPLFGIEPAPLVPVKGGLMEIEDTGLMVSIADFREWIRRSQVQAPESWADALRDSIQWNKEPIESTQIITGEPKGRPRQLPDNAQAEANEVALELYNLSRRMPTKKMIATKLATNYGVAWSTVKDRFKVKLCKEYIKQQKQ